LDFGFWISRGDWLTQRTQRWERGDLIWKCEMRPAVAGHGRAYARMLDWEEARILF